ncbi:MAG: cell division protein FtsZ [Alphaproteobacteria bacterium]
MNIKMQPTEIQKLSPKIAVIGVGGAGGNAVNNMIASNLEGCEFLVCNTDSQALEHSLSDHKVQLGVNVTGGLGAGSKPEVGQASAEESLEDVLRYLDGANMAFVTAGMGGGTGTGAAPVIAKACRQQGILTVGVVTKPFHFEGVHRMEQAEQGIKEMQQYVDTLIVIPNQNLFRIANEKTTFAEAFKMADTVLQSGVRGVTDLMVRPGLVNLDFADIRTAMLQMGKAMMGTGEASGEKRAIEAAESAINNPLLDDVSMKGANGVIINVTGGMDMTLFEADEACNRIRDEVDPSANIIFGATFDDSLDGFMRVSIVATGIESEAEKGKIFGGKSGVTSTGGSGGNTPAGNPVQSDGGVNRVVPNAASVETTAQATKSEDVKSSVQISKLMSGRDVVKSLTAPSPIVAPEKVQAPQVTTQEVASTVGGEKQDNSTSIDMFEQSEFAPQLDEATASDIELRGQTYNDSFIPPKPMEADIPIPENGIGSHISNFNAQHVPEGLVSEEKKSQGAQSSLRMTSARPVPQQPAHTQEQQRSPSLFERITGSVQQHIGNFRDDGDMVRPAPLTGEAKPQKKISDAPVQGSLDISAPAAKPAVKIDDELDIPAFLRRQAN